LKAKKLLLILLLINIDIKAQELFQLQKIDSSLAYIEKAIKNSKNKTIVNFLDSNNYLKAAQNFLNKMDLVKAEENLKIANYFLINSNDYNNLSILNNTYANFYLLKNNYNEAEFFYQKNVDLYNEGKKIDKTFVLLAYQGLFTNSFSKSNLKNSFQTVNEYLTFVKKNFPGKLNEAYNLIGVFYSISGDYTKSITSFKKSIALTEQKNKHFISSIYTSLGISYLKQQIKKDSAMFYLNKSNDYFEKTNDKQEQARVFFAYSNLLEKENKYDEAENYIQKAIYLIPENDFQNTKIIYNNQLYNIQLSKILSDSITLNSNFTKRKELEDIVLKLTNNSKTMMNNLLANYAQHDNYEKLAIAHEKLDNHKIALEYLKKSISSKEKVYGLDKLKELSDFQSEYNLNLEKASIKLEEESKRIRLQKEIELKALRFEFEKKEANAKTDEERKRIRLEEDLKRREIEFKFTQEQQAAKVKYEKEKEIEKLNQEKKDTEAKAELDHSKNIRNIWALGAGLSLLLLGFAVFSFFQKQKDNKKIAEEKKKSDDLLLNILPFEIAEELKEKGKTSAKHYNEVSVIFTDFVNFTKMTEKIEIQDMLNELNVCFTAFDNIMEKYDMEKIKTIGDAYLAVSGVPLSNEYHAENAVKAGLEILNFIEDRKKSNPNSFDIRIGIHSGPVIAGIVGIKKFSYDIWGDTVNTAARIEQNSEKGLLNISGTTYNLIKDSFSCEYRGKINTKGKGDLDMYFVKNNN
jgi:adenylate cyclase